MDRSGNLLFRGLVSENKTKYKTKYKTFTQASNRIIFFLTGIAQNVIVLF